MGVSTAMASESIVARVNLVLVTKKVTDGSCLSFDAMADLQESKEVPEVGI